MRDRKGFVLGATMRAQLSYLRYYATENLWVIPSALTAGAVVLAYAMVTFDQSPRGQWVLDQGFFFEIDPQDARLTLSTIAGSLITVTSLVFSLTVLALTLASQQLGPRLLRNFVRDRPTQIVLGVFISTFVFALLVLGTVSSSRESSFIPYSSLSASMILAIASFGALIYFIHHVARTIQADSVIASVTDDLHAIVERTFPEPAEAGAASGGGPTDAPAPANPGEDHVEIDATENGYIQIVDHEGLARLATERDFCIRLPLRAGHFVISGSALAQVVPATHLSNETIEAIRDHIKIGSRRTPAQDLEFLVANLVEIALRALSPGINDHYTATACIDRLCEVLAKILRRRPAFATLKDDSGAIRLQREPPGFPHILDSAFNEIRQSARENVAVICRMADGLTMLAPLAERQVDRQSLFRHYERLQRTVQKFIDDQDDRDRVIESLAALRAAIHGSRRERRAEVRR